VLVAHTFSSQIPKLSEMNPNPEKTQEFYYHDQSAANICMPTTFDRQAPAPKLPQLSLLLEAIETDSQSSAETSRASTTTLPSIENLLAVSAESSMDIDSPRPISFHHRPPIMSTMVSLPPVRHIITPALPAETSRTSISSHQSIKNTETYKGSFSCQECGTGFRRTEELDRHLVAQHGHRLFICPYCDSSFTTRRTLKHHIAKARVSGRCRTARGPVMESQSKLAMDIEGRLATEVESLTSTPSSITFMSS
jgi:uncharacterized C2H2 Zn-finger protein